ncbi:MAG: hypothetical protein HWQ38_32335 [Nostoc sp. NMS7]|uniref:hypothetical protein n=1 Tax=Nostoc sp. NMS7 TaxID=2815391 RepID=UPI0025F1F9FD|nr:hypothetical protein [Nostoc sp. NMS7]MBN3950906.1 hypothetical protein [Nostoc sp. NMS7]
MRSPTGDTATPESFGNAVASPVHHTTPRRYATSYQVHATKATTLTMPNNHDGNLEQSTIAIANGGRLRHRTERMGAPQAIKR